MNKLLKLVTAAALATTALAGAALAQSASATATADLNIRSGPGPQYASIGFIASGDTAAVDGCLEAASGAGSPMTASPAGPTPITLPPTSRARWWSSRTDILMWVLPQLPMMAMMLRLVALSLAQRAAQSSERWSVVLSVPLSVVLWVRRAALLPAQ